LRGNPKWLDPWDPPPFPKRVNDRAADAIALGGKGKAFVGRADSDEQYVLDLCDKILDKKSERQKRFTFLFGDPGLSGRRALLPVDAFYPDLKLAIEYREVQHSRPVGFFDKPHRLTISGVHRGKQRSLYDQRRREVLPANGIQLVEIDSHALTADGRGKLRKDEVRDLATIKSALEAAGVLFIEDDRGEGFV
jgi:hypothetical protein